MKKKINMIKEFNNYFDPLLEYSPEEYSEMEKQANEFEAKMRYLLNERIVNRKKEKEKYLANCLPIEQYSEYEIEKMQKAILDTVIILQRKELELNKKGIYLK